MPGRFPQLNSLGVRQACGDWPNNPQSAEATCPTGATGDPVTVNMPAGSFYADTIENADELALEEAQEQAEAALECVFPDCTYSAISSYAQASETAWKQYLYQLTTTNDPPDFITEFGAMSDDGKRVVFSRTGAGPSAPEIGAWVVDTTNKPENPPGLRGFWSSGMTPFALEAGGTDWAPPADRNPAVTRAYGFIGRDDPANANIENKLWLAADYEAPEQASGITRWISISGNGETLIGQLPSNQYLIRCSGEPDFLIPEEDTFFGTAGKMNYCGTRAIGTTGAGLNGFWDKTGAGIWEFTQRPIQAGWESDTVVMTHINGQGNIIFGTRIEDSTGDAFLVRWLNGVPTGYANPDGFVLDYISEDGTTAVMANILQNATQDAPASIWDVTNGFRNLYDLIEAVNFLFIIVGDPWTVDSMEVVGVSGNGKHLLVRVTGPNIDEINVLMYVYLG